MPAGGRGSVLIPAFTIWLISREEIYARGSILMKSGAFV